MPLLNRLVILERYVDYAQSEHANGVPMSLLLKPIFNIAHGLPISRKWKAILMDIQQTKDSAALLEAISLFVDTSVMA